MAQNERDSENSLNQDDFVSTDQNSTSTELKNLAMEPTQPASPIANDSSYSSLLSPSVSGHANPSMNHTPSISAKEATPIAERIESPIYKLGITSSLSRNPSFLNESFNQSNFDYTKINQTPTFAQIPCSTVLDRMSKGSECIFELSQLFASILELNHKNLSYTNGISRTKIYEHEINQSSSEKALGFLKNYNLFQSRDYLSYGKELNEGSFKTLEATKLERSTLLKKYELSLEKANRELKAADEELIKAKANYVKSKSEMISAKDKLIAMEEEENNKINSKVSDSTPARFSFRGYLKESFDIREMEKDRQIKKVRKRYNTLLQCTSDIIAKKKKLREKYAARDRIVQDAVKSYQVLEEKRLTSSKAILQQYCFVERQLLEARLKLLSDLDSAVGEIDITNDLQNFIHNNKMPEFTHKYTKAMDLMDWDYDRRQVTNSSGGVVSIDSSSPVKLSSSKSETFDNDISGTNSSGSKDQDPVTSEIKILTIGSQYFSKSASSTVLEGGTPGKASENSITQSEFRSLSPTNILSGSEDGIKDDIGLKLDDSQYSLGNTEVVSQVGGFDEDNNGGDDINAVNNSFSGSNEKGSFDSVAAAAINEKELLQQQYYNAIGLIFNVSSVSPNDSTIKIDNSDTTESNSAVTFDASETEKVFTKLFSSSTIRDLFLQSLDENRGRNSKLGPQQFGSLNIAMKVSLDYCNEAHDIKSAMRILNMSNTFHLSKADKKSEPASLISPSSTSANPSPSSPLVTSAASSDGKVYILHRPEIRLHPIWRTKGFWESALFERISGELGMFQPILWDDLSPEQLRETVAGTHNIIFGQLATIAFSMFEIGLTFEEVLGNVLEMSQAAELVEEQEHDLIKSICSYFNRTL